MDEKNDLTPEKIAENVAKKILSERYCNNVLEYDDLIAYGVYMLELGLEAMWQDKTNEMRLRMADDTIHN